MIKKILTGLLVLLVFIVAACAVSNPYPKMSASEVCSYVTSALPNETGGDAFVRTVITYKAIQAIHQDNGIWKVQVHLTITKEMYHRGAVGPGEWRALFGPATEGDWWYTFNEKIGTVRKL